ncbi:MAG: S9 family peptidase [Propionibacteriaceae bacterium]|nr:S9 family peptidase [Propionibacteriaceae bacterium]
MRADQIDLLTTVSAPTVHPDGSFALVAATRPSFEADAYTGQLWRIPLSGGEPVRQTRGFADSSPQISPDGRLVAFLRRSPGGRAQVFVAPSTGGEAAQVTEQKLGVGAFCWSPDSARLAFTSRVPAEGRYGTLDGVTAAQEDPRHLTGYQIQSNGLGWSTDRVAQLFVVDAPDPHAEPPIQPVGRAARDTDADAADAGAPAPTPAPAWNVPAARQLTDGPRDVREPVFTPDGDAVLVTAPAGEDADEHLRTAIHHVCVESGKVTPVVADAQLSFSAARPVGGWLFVLGSDLGPDGRDFVATNAAVFVVARDGGAPVRLTDPETHDLGGPLMPAGEDAIWVVRGHRGGSELLRVAADGTVVTRASGQPSVLSAAARPGTDAVVATVASVRSPGEVALIDADRVDVLTDFAGPLHAATEVLEPVELIATAPDGTPVHGWVVTPPGEGPHPVLLTIHGGPYAAYGSDFFDEFQVFAEAGYAVVYCNPRGSGTYGQAHGAAIRHDFGRLDTDDVLAFLDHATATVAGLDASRVGIQGGSYGGYLTAWIIAHHHRFAGAIVERGFLDPASFLGSSDIGWFFMPAYNGAALADQDRQSPTLLADQVTTPTFVVHSELDLRCPLSQALRYFTALKAAGVDTELLVFPGEDHELSRSGTPWHRRQRFDAMLAWWERHLPVEPAHAAQPDPEG